MENLELTNIVKRFADSGWTLLAVPAANYLKDKNTSDQLITAVKEADKQCGTCGCDFDPLYKRFLELVSNL